MKLFLIGELPMLFKDKRRRSRHEHNSKKCRLTLGSSGTFLLYNENHQQCWWFQKALAMSRKSTSFDV